MNYLVVWKGTGSKRRCVIRKDEMMYIQLLDSLQSLLRNEVVLTEVRSLSANNDNLYHRCRNRGGGRGGHGPPNHLSYMSM